jgi:CMP-N,N'-diacetyllegionaminic acid synthase
MSMLCVIPARSGSKGVVNKNIRELGGKPLLGIAIEKALRIKAIDTVVVSTDSAEYASIASDYGAQVPFLRPAEFADDKVRLHYVLQHALKTLDPGGTKFTSVISLLPSAPLVSLETISSCVSKFNTGQNQALGTASLIISGHPYLAKTLHENGTCSDFLQLEPKVPRYPRQVRPNLYFFNGCIFIRNSELLHNINDDLNCLGENPYMFLTEDNESINIDTELDLKLVELIFNEQSGGFNND